MKMGTERAEEVVRTLNVVSSLEIPDNAFLGLGIRRDESNRGVDDVDSFRELARNSIAQLGAPTELEDVIDRTYALVDAGQAKRPRLAAQHPDFWTTVMIPLMTAVKSANESYLKAQTTLHGMDGFLGQNIAVSATLHAITNVVTKPTGTSYKYTALIQELGRLHVQLIAFVEELDHVMETQRELMGTFPTAKTGLRQLEVQKMQQARDLLATEIEKLRPICTV